MKPDINNFWRKIEKTNDCWLWRANICRKYGHVKFKGKTYLAHRFMWEINFGKIPQNLFVCHHCDNPICVNPAHLFLGTHTDNMRDMYKKGRGPKRDSQNSGVHKLTWDTVYLIRQSHPALSCAELGRQYGVSTSLISLIVRNKIWKKENHYVKSERL